MRHMMRGAGIVWGFAALLAGGCSPLEDGLDAPLPETATAEATTPAAGDAATRQADRSREFTGRVRVQGTGAAPFEWEGTQTVILNRVGYPGISVNLLSAGFQFPEPLPEDRALRFRWGFDLKGVYDDRPGVFTFDGVSSPSAGSNVVFVWMRVKDPSKRAVFEDDEVDFIEYFTVLRQPCTAEVGEGERTGTLRCPEVANEEGETASFTVSWEEIGPAPSASPS